MTTKEHLRKHDEEIAAIRKLIRDGMRLVSEYHQETRGFREETRRYVRETRKEMKELREAQRRTEASLKAFIDQMRGGGGGNGHAKGKIDAR